MVEGQNGLTWERWRHILRLAERLGFPSLFRSDHYMISEPRDSLEAYLSFVMAAEETSSLRFGPLVSPVTFRAPLDVARMAAQIQQLSGGRFVMGLGAGWNDAEHKAFGVPFPPVAERMDRLEEALQLTRAVWQPGPTTFDGRYYQLRGADVLPKPDPAPPILVGGAGERRTLRLVAQYADEWNCVNQNPESYAAKTAVLERHCEAVGRDPATIRRSMMMFALVGPTPDHVDAATRVMLQHLSADSGTSTEEFRRATAVERGLLVGGTDELVDTLGRLAESGLQEIDMQHLVWDSDDIPIWLAEEVAPLVKDF